LQANSVKKFKSSTARLIKTMIDCSLCQWKHALKKIQYFVWCSALF